MKILVASIFLVSLYSCSKNKSTISAGGSATQITPQNTDDVDAYYLRFINLLLLDSIRDHISSHPNSDLILIQANKCNVCTEVKLEKVNATIIDLTNPIVVVIGSKNFSLQKIISYLPNAEKKLYYKTADVERLGLNLMENYLIEFRNGLYLSSSILE
jgi:hypothetical protein